MTTDHGPDQSSVGRSASDAERPRKRKRRRVDRGARLIDGAAGSNARSPQLKLFTTVTMFKPAGMGQYAPGSSSCADAHTGISSSVSATTGSLVRTAGGGCLRSAAIAIPRETSASETHSDVAGAFLVERCAIVNATDENGLAA